MTAQVQGIRDSHTTSRTSTRMCVCQWKRVPSLFQSPRDQLCRSMDIRSRSPDTLRARPACSRQWKREPQYRVTDYTGRVLQLAHTAPRVKTVNRNHGGVETRCTPSDILRLPPDLCTIDSSNQLAIAGLIAAWCTLHMTKQLFRKRQLLSDSTMLCWNPSPRFDC